MPSIDLKNTVLKIKDNGSNTLTVEFGEGTLTWSRKTEREYKLSRGKINTVKNADDSPLEVSFDAIWEYLYAGSSSGATPTLYEVLHQEGAAADWASTGTGCEPYAVDLELTYSPQPYTCGDKEVITFPDFRVESFDPNLDAGEVSVSGKCNVVKPVIVRSANSSGLLP